MNTTTITPTCADGAARVQHTRRGSGRSPADRAKHMQAWLDRRQAIYALCRKDAQRRLRGQGPVAAVRDAMAALADPSADRWQTARREIDAAQRTGSERAVSAAARRWAMTAAGDSVRGGSRAPDPEIAQTAATAFLVIQLAPRPLVALHQRRAAGKAGNDATENARLRMRQEGGRAAVRDAVAALEDPGASRWQAQRARVIAAARAGDEQRVVTAARDGAREAARDAAFQRGDVDSALTAATAFRLLQFAPRSLLQIHRTPQQARRAATRPS